MVADRSILLVDVGNSRIKWAYSRGGQFTMGDPVEYGANDLAASIEGVWGNDVQLDAVWIASVGGDKVGSVLNAWVSRCWELRPNYAVVRQGFLGLVTRYAKPEQLGVDRWLALLAVRQQMSMPVCVVDCGTAITLDVLDEQGVHIGGMIAPGLRVLEQSLIRRVPGLQVTPSDYQGVLATNTTAGLLSGARQAALGLIERSLVDVAGELKTTPELILTGGDAGFLKERLHQACRWEPHLVLQGLSLLAENT